MVLTINHYKHTWIFLPENKVELLIYTIFAV